MSGFKWYRKWRGGYWVYYHSFWQKVGIVQFIEVSSSRRGEPKWSLEDYT